MFEELKQRNVFKAAAAYVLVAWLLLQICSITFPALQLPDWTMTFVTVLMVLGFPFVLMFAWALDLSPDGVKSESKKTSQTLQNFLHSRQVDFAIIGLLAGVIIVMLVDDFVMVEATFEVAPIQVAETDAAKPAAFVTAPTEATRKSIAVLPFVNMSTDEDFFADGLSEEILNLLAKNRDLKVIGRTSSFAYKGKNEDLRIIGKALGVDTILEGSVRKSDNKLRITAQLIEVEAGTHLWSETYDRKLKDVFAIQDDVAAKILGALEIHLGGAKDTPSRSTPTENMEAYALFLKATTLSDGAPRLAVPLLLKATELDPKYAEAFELLAFSYWNLSEGIINLADRPLAQAASVKALALNPSLVLAQAISEMSRKVTSREDSISTFENALRQEPNNAKLLYMLSWSLVEAGYFEEAVKWAEQWKEIDPQSEDAYMHLVLVNMAAGGIEAAQETLDLARILDMSFVDPILTEYYLNIGEDEKAIFLSPKTYFDINLNTDDFRDLVQRSRDPISGADYLNRRIHEFDALLDPEEAGSQIANIPFWYHDFGHLDPFYEAINAIDTIETDWTRAGWYMAHVHFFRHEGALQHPGYLIAAEKQGLLKLWDSRGAPDHCAKETGTWVCE